MKKMNVKPLIISALSAVAFGAVGVGTTFALFTDKAETSISVQSGKVEIEDSIVIKSVESLNTTDTDTKITDTDNKQASFQNGGSVAITTTGGVKSVDIQKMTPGDKVVLEINEVNKSNVKIKTRFKATHTYTSEYDLFKALTITYQALDKNNNDITYKFMDWNLLDIPAAEQELIAKITVTIEFKDHDNGQILFGEDNNDNDYQNSNCSIVFAQEAVQGNAAVMSLIEEMNNKLASESVRNNTLTDALADVSTLANVDVVQAMDYVWNSETDRFEYAAEVTSGTKNKYFKVYSSMPSAQTYSIYAYGWTGVTSAALNGVGFDVGTSTGIEAISYTNTTGEAHNVVIRTNGGRFTINAENDEVTHYGQADYVDIIAVKQESYEERGTTSLIKVAKGNVELNSESKVGEIHFAKTGDVFTDIKVTLENGAKLPDLSRDPVGTSLLDNVLICEVVTSGTSEFYWLNAKGTIEDGEVLVSSTKTGDKTAATAENSTAVAIANAKSGETVTDNGTTIKAASEMTAEELVEATATGAARTFAEIGSREELIAFRDAWNEGKIARGTFKLTSNIDLSSEEWLPIGTWQYPFNGVFDGQNYTISGMRKSTATDKDVYATGNTIGYGQVFGFVGIVGDGDVTVKNVHFTTVNVALSETGKNVGTVIGYAPSNDKFKSNKDGNNWSAKWANNDTIGTDSVTIENVSTQGTLVCASHGAGIIAKMYGSGKLIIKNCINDVDVDAKGGSASGIVAIVQNGVTFDVEITGCTNKGNIVGYGGYTAGIFNSSVVNSNNVVKNCVNEGNINGNSQSAAGLICMGNGNIEIQNLENKGNVTGSGDYVGGILSGTGNQIVTIKTGFLKNSGNVSGTKLAGGITGRIIKAMSIEQNVELENKGNVIVSTVGTVESNINHPYGAGAIFAYLGNNNSFESVTFKNTGTITAPEGSHTGLVAAAISNGNYSFINCSYVNTGAIADLDSNHADPELSHRSHKCSIGFNSVEKGIFGFVPKDTGDIVFGEDTSTTVALFTDELTLLFFEINDENWNENKLQKEVNGFTYEITREPREAYWYIYSLSKVVNQ